MLYLVPAWNVLSIATCLHAVPTTCKRTQLNTIPSQQPETAISHAVFCTFRQQKSQRIGLDVHPMLILNQHPVSLAFEARSSRIFWTVLTSTVG